MQLCQVQSSYIFTFRLKYSFHSHVILKTQHRHIDITQRLFGLVSSALSPGTIKLDIKCVHYIYIYIYKCILYIIHWKLKWTLLTTRHMSNKLYDLTQWSTHTTGWLLINELTSAWVLLRDALVLVINLKWVQLSEHFFRGIP